VVHVEEADAVDANTAIKVVKNSKLEGLDEQSKSEVLKDATKTLNKKH